MLKGFTLRAQHVIDSKEGVDAFLARGRPSFLINTLTTTWFNLPDGKDAYYILNNEYDVSTRRKKRYPDGGAVQQG